MNKKLNYKAHYEGVLEKAVGTPNGVYYVDMDNGRFFLESEDDKELAKMVAAVFAKTAAEHGDEGAEILLTILKTFNEVPDEHVEKCDENYRYSYLIEGELVPLVKTGMGCFYANKEDEVFYFDTPHDGFIRRIEMEKFIEGLDKDRHSDDAERSKAANAILKILKNWTELNKEDVYECTEEKC